MLGRACSALSSTFLPTSAMLYIMKQKNQTRLMSRNSGRMPLTSELKLNYTTATNKSYEGLKTLNYISPSKGSLTTAYIENQLEQEVKKIKTIMANMLNKPAHLEELIMMDAIQRLGLQCYFQDDIEAALDKHSYEANSSTDGVECLHDFALRFRLLRQQGYRVPGDAFNKFKNKDGKFKEEICKDIKGMMSLHEASHLRIPGDHILDDAGEFTEKVLQSLKHDGQYSSGVIWNTLNNPCHKSLPRLTAKKFLQNFETSLNCVHDFSCNSVWTSELQNLAEIDIYMAQINHKDEIKQVSRWWKGLRITEELKLARNQPEKWHNWSFACLSAPNMIEQRVGLTKAISFIYIIDDIFDVYGTVEELTLFTEAVNRSEYDNFKGLPNYMKICLKKLAEFNDEISTKICKTRGWNPREFLQTVWVELFNAYLVESKWVASGDTPSTVEYLENGRISVGVPLVSAYLFLFLDKGGNNERIDYFNSHPAIVSLTATIFRLLNDLGSGKDENPNGHDGSYLACYMHEHKNSSAEKAREHVDTIISDAWKSLNEMCLSSPFSTDFTASVLSLAKMVPVMYSNDDSHDLPNLKIETHQIIAN